MLRRKPTAITLTTEDIAIYEDARVREATEQKYKELKDGILSQTHNTDQQARHQFFQDNIQEPTMQERILGTGSQRR